MLCEVTTKLVCKICFVCFYLHHKLCFYSLPADAVSARIPDSYIYQIRKKYLDYDIRAQHKEYLLSCRHPSFRVLLPLSDVYFFQFIFIFMCIQFLVGQIATFQNNAWVQEWFFSGWWSVIYLLEIYYFSFWVLLGCTTLLCPRHACNNSSE